MVIVLRSKQDRKEARPLPLPKLKKSRAAGCPAFPQEAGHPTGGETPTYPIRPGASIIYAGVPCVQGFKELPQFLGGANTDIFYFSYLINLLGKF